MLFDVDWKEKSYREYDIERGLIDIILRLISTFVQLDNTGLYYVDINA